MRHAHRHGHLSRPTAPREAMLANMAVAVLRHGRIRTTLAKAKQAKRLTDRLITLGKDGSIHARRQAYRFLQDRQRVKQLFGDVAPRFLDVRGGYTRVLRLAPRSGDGAPQALLELTRLPVEIPKTPPKAKAQQAAPPSTASVPKASTKPVEDTPKPKGFLEGLRHLFRPKKGGAAS